MSAQQRGSSVTAHRVTQQRVDIVCGDRVQPNRRFVEQQHLGFGDERRGEHYPPLVAARQLREHLVAVWAKLEDFLQAYDALDGPGEPVAVPQPARHAHQYVPRNMPPSTSRVTPVM